MGSAAEYENQGPLWRGRHSARVGSIDGPALLLAGRI